jgi:hypothetical protein
MDWEILFPRLTDALVPNGKLALVGRRWGLDSSAEFPIIARHSTIEKWLPANPAAELEKRGFFVPEGEARFDADWHPTIDEYIASRNSHSGLSLDRMADGGTAFVNELRELIVQLVDNGKIALLHGRLLLKSSFAVRWGRPQS